MSSLSIMRTDQELLAAYAATGDESAFAELVSRHGRMVYRTCLRSFGNEHDAEEAAQAVFLVLVRKRRALRSEGELAAWLHRVAKNVAHLAIRSRARRSRHEAEAAMVRAAESAVDDVGARHAVPLQDLDRELDALPAAQRQAVLLRYLEGLPQEEAARAAGCPQGTLARRAQIGLERLRERLCQRGQVLSAAALAGLLGAEASAAVPASLLPSILAVSKLAAVAATGAVGAVGAAGAAGSVGAQHAVPVQLAEGVLKMMFWAKFKVAAAVCAAVLAVGGGGGAVAAKLLAAESVVPKAQGSPAEASAKAGPKPKADPSVVEKGIECQVTALPGGGQVALSAGSEQGLKPGFELDVERDGKKVATLKVTAVETKSATAELVSATGELKVGDKAATRFREVGTESGQRAPAAQPGRLLPVFATFGGEWMELKKDADTEIWPAGAEARGGRIVHARVSAYSADGRTVTVTIAGLKISKPSFAAVLDHRDGAEQSVQLTDYPGAGNLSVKLHVGDPRSGVAAGEEVNGLKLSISADKLEAKAGDEVKIAASLENVSKEALRVFKYYSEVSWELNAPDGESLQYVPYRGPMPGMMPPNDLSAFPEIAAGDRLSYPGNSISGNPPIIGVGGEPRFTRVCLLKPGVYKLTAVYTNKTDTLWTKDFKGQQAVPGKVWKGTVRSNTLELKLGGEFKAPAEAAPWPPAGIPGVTPPQKGERAAGAAGRDDRIEADLLKQPPPPYDENKKREIFGQTDPKLDAGK